MAGATSDPDRFEEAVEWFRARVPLTDEEYQQLQESARKRAFLVSRTANLDVVTAIWRAIDKALARGDDFRDFKKELPAKLLESWSGQRLESIFRTNVQTAYAAGRWKQATDPDVVELRPYWMFDAVMDSSTSEVCSACNGTVLPADDPWWQTHHAPLHHRCRSGFITLSAEEAKARGITTSKPVHGPDKGFGAPPGKNDWQPNPGDYPADLWSAHEDS